MSSTKSTGPRSVSTPAPSLTPSKAPSVAPKAAEEKETKAPERAQLSEWVRDEQAEARAEAVKFSAAKAQAALEQKGAVALTRSELSLGATTVPLPKGMKSSLVLLDTNRAVMASAWAGIQSGQATWLHTPDGAGTLHALRFLLEATGTKHRTAGINPSTTLEELVGSLRPSG
jgi:hypothetical protein